MAYITLDAGASGTDDFYNGQVLRLTGGVGVGQIRTIISYIGATKRAYVSRDWGTVPNVTSTFTIAVGVVFDKSPSEILTVRRIMYKAAANAAGGAAKTLYNKVFAKNGHATLAALGASISEAADPSGLFSFALATAVGDTESTTARTVAPAAVTAFDSTAKAVPGTDLAAGIAIGVWLKLDLAAGAAAQKTSVTMRLSASSV